MFLATVQNAEEANAPVLTESGLTFQARNPFFVGDSIDWLTPDGMASFELKELYDAKGFPVKEAQTNHVVTIPLPAALQGQNEASLRWSILRSKERMTVVS
jgi:hypothetical protein